MLTEALLAVPFVTLFAAGILEFGNIFWERMQIDAGLRDAGRYMSRCRPTTPTYTSSCSEVTAKLIAFYGTQSPAEGAALRVRGWGPSLADITVTSRQCQWHHHRADRASLRDFSPVRLARPRCDHHQFLA